MTEAISKDQVLELWQRQWGKIRPVLIVKFLENQYLENIVKYDFDSVGHAIAQSQRLVFILEILEEAKAVQNCPSCGASITNIEVNCRCS